MASGGDALKVVSTEVGLANREDAMARRLRRFRESFEFEEERLEAEETDRLEKESSCRPDSKIAAEGGPFEERAEAADNGSDEELADMGSAEEPAEDTSQAEPEGPLWAVEECAEFFFADLPWTDSDLGFVSARAEIAPGQPVTLQIPWMFTTPERAGALRSANARFERIQREFEAIKLRLIEWIARLWDKDGSEDELDPDCAQSDAGSLANADALPSFPRDLVRLTWDPVLITFDVTARQFEWEPWVRLTFRGLLGEQALDVSIRDDFNPVRVPSCGSLQPAGFWRVDRDSFWMPEPPRLDAEISVRDAKLGEFRLVRYFDGQEGYQWESSDGSLFLTPLPTAGTASKRSSFAEALQGIPELLALARALSASDCLFKSEIVHFLTDEEVPGPWLSGMYVSARDSRTDDIRDTLSWMLDANTLYLSVYADGSARLSVSHQSRWKEHAFTVSAIRGPQGRISKAIVSQVGLEPVAVERSARSDRRPARS